MPSIGLSMIVKNGGADLRLCLDSVTGLVDQIVVADTGSTDDTLVIAQEFHATVLSIPWEDHFAKARNAALDAMTTDWILVLDADEALEPISAADFRRLAEIDDHFGGYLVPIRNYFRESNVSLPGQMGEQVHHCGPAPDARTLNARSSAEHTLCRLFRRDPRIRYRGRVHEVVEPSIKALGLRLAQAPFRILHYGQLADPALRDGKNHFYRRLGRLKTAEEPDNFLAWYELGSLEQVRFHNPIEALLCLHRAVDLAPAGHPSLPAAWTRIFQIHADRGDLVQALQAAAQIGPTGEQDLAVVLQKADLLAAAHRFSEAEAEYQRALSLGAPSSAAFWPIQNRLGLVEVRLGHHTQGLDRLERSTAACPQFLEHHEHRMQGHLLAGNLREAAEAACLTLGYFQNARLYLRAALLLARTGDLTRQKSILEQGLSRFPTSAELTAALAQLETANASCLP